MPDIVMHYGFGQEVLAGLPEEIRSAIGKDVYDFALYGPDVWFMYSIGKVRQGRGRRMHTTRTGDFLTGLAVQARTGKSRKEMFSYLAGFLCHYALDSVTHPYIIWRTTETWPTKRAHRDLEHALDVKRMQREGVWGEKHPVTDHSFPKLRLPRTMEEDLNRVYQDVYGWPGAWASLNTCYARYQALYRMMEKPISVLTVLATVIPTHRLRSVPHARSAFLDRDIENLEHREWSQPYARDAVSRESFPELYEKAKKLAGDMIRDAYACVYTEEMTVQALRERLGSRSYLSGLDTEDPRNWQVRSLMPPEDKG